MSANLTTLAHFSVSAARAFPKFAGEPGSGVLLTQNSLACKTGFPRSLLMLIAFIVEPRLGRRNRPVAPHPAARIKGRET
jgi:hypothetical protein